MAEDSSQVRTAKGNQRSRKVLAVAVVIAVVAASGTFVWVSFLKPWSIKDLAKHVINDPSPAAPGFDHNLAGKSITLKGKVTSFEIRQTTQGNLTFYNLDDFEDLSLVCWGDPPFKLNETISTRLSFEWSTCNDETHVYSPQVGFPGLQSMPSIGPIVKSITMTSGTVFVTSSTDTGKILMTVADIVEHLSLANLSCTLSAGVRSWAADYVEVLGFPDPNMTYGRTVDRMTSLANGEGMNHTFRFVDSDSDNNLSVGDRFEVSGLEPIQEESALRSYLLRVTVPQKVPPFAIAPCCLADYFVLNSRGLFMLTDSTPYARLKVSANQTVADGALVSVVGRASWGEVSVMLSNPGGENGVWQVPSGALSDDSPQTMDLGARSLGTISVGCSIRDITGNGFIDQGDSVQMKALEGSSFSTMINYTVSMIYVPHGEQMTYGPPTTFSG